MERKSINGEGWGRTTYEGLFRFSPSEISFAQFAQFAYHAARCGNLTAVNYLLGHTADINLRSYGWHEALFVSIVMGHFDIASALVIKGINVNVSSNEYGWTPLFAACARGRTDIVSLLLDFRCDVNIRNEFGWTPLHHIAYWRGYDNIVKLLVSHAYATGSRTADDYEPALSNQACPFESYRQGTKSMIADQLISHGCDMNGRDKYGATPLHLSCVRGNADIAHVLISRGCNTRVRDNKGKTPLWLVGYWSESNLPGEAGIKKPTPEVAELLKAIQANDVARGRFLLQRGIKTIFPVLRHTTLFSGSWWGRDRLVYHDYNTLSSYEWDSIPLFLAAFLGLLEYVEMLLDYERSVNFTNEIDFTDATGRTALFYACQWGHLDVVNCLLDRGARVNHTDNELNTPLHSAVDFGRVETVRLLVAAGGNLDLRNADNLSAMDIVLERMKTTDKDKRQIYGAMLDINSLLETMRIRFRHICLRCTGGSYSPPQS